MTRLLLYRGIPSSEVDSICLLLLRRFSQDVYAAVKQSLEYLTVQIDEIISRKIRMFIIASAVGIVVGIRACGQKRLHERGYYQRYQ